MVLGAPSTVSPGDGAPHMAAGPSSLPPFTEKEEELIGSGSFCVVDYVVLVLLTLACVVLGTVAAIRKNKNNSADDYLLGGRSMSVVPVALSLLGGFVSAISILGNSTEMYYYGTQLEMSLLGFLWGALIVTKVILPVIFPLQLVSAFEYLELRFRSTFVKKIASILSLCSSSFYMGVCLYAPSLTFSTITRISTWISVVGMGLVCAIYISIGGVRAVVYTDVLQTALMFFGIALVVIQTTIDVGGVGTVWDTARKGDRLEFFNLDPNPLVRHTFWSVQIIGITIMISAVMLSQAQFQRLISVSTLKQSKWLCYLFVIGLTILWSMFNFSGLVAYAQYRNCDPMTAGLIEKKDGILPFLVVDKFGNGWGLVGLFVTAVYGGVLSSVSSTANSIATLLWKDFLCELTFFSRMTPAGVTKTIKLLSLISGLGAIALAMLVVNMGTLFQVAIGMNSIISSPICGLFIAGICTPWVSTKGALAGFFSTLLINIIFIVGKFTYGGGQAKPLPFSVDGCPAGILANTTSLGPNDTGVITSTVANFITAEERYYPAIFDLSYCYYGFVGIVIFLVMSSAASFFTGVTRPYDVDPRLVNKTSLKMYFSLWRRFSKQEVKGFEMVETREKEKKMDGMESSYMNGNELDTLTSNKEKCNQSDILAP